MTQPLKIRNTGKIVDLLAKEVPDDQWLRELVENGFNAGASRIVIDAYVCEDGRDLIRVTDNGHGMKPEQLKKRLQELGDPQRHNNYGIGARIATLKYNPAGVAWVSKAFGWEPAMMFIKKDPRHGFAIMEYLIDDEDHIDIVAGADEGMLPDWIKESGTSVILHGDGRNPSWRDKLPFRMAKKLAHRYWTFGETSVEILSHHHHGRIEPVPAFSTYLDKATESSGTVPLDDGGTIDWYVFKTSALRESNEAGYSSHFNHLRRGVCVREGNELYDWSDNGRLAKFGAYSKEAQKRTLLIIRPAAGSVETLAGRSRLVMRGTARDLPWQQWAREFVCQLPREIADLAPKTTISSLNPEELDRMFGAEWRERIRASNAVRSTARNAMNATERSDLVAADNQPEEREWTFREAPEITPEPVIDEPPIDIRDTDDGQKKERRRRAATVQNDGAMRAKAKFTNGDMPQITIVEEEDWSDENLHYDFAFQSFVHRNDGSTGPVLSVRKNGLAIQSQISHWTRQRPDISPETLANVVTNVYGIEIASKIVHFYGVLKDRDGFIGDDVEVYLSPQALTIASLGLRVADNQILLDIDLLNLPSEEDEEDVG